VSRSLYFYAPSESAVIFGGVPSTIEWANVFEYLNVGRAQCREAGTSKKSPAFQTDSGYTQRNGDGVSPKSPVKHETRHAGRNHSTVRLQLCARPIRDSHRSPVTSLQYNKRIINELAAALYTKSVLLVAMNFW
jgi:hypothetical protein